MYILSHNYMTRSHFSVERWPRRLFGLISVTLRRSERRVYSKEKLKSDFLPFSLSFSHFKEGNRVYEEAPEAPEDVVNRGLSFRAMAKRKRSKTRKKRRSSSDSEPIPWWQINSHLLQPRQYNYTPNRLPPPCFICLSDNHRSPPSPSPVCCFTNTHTLHDFLSPFILSPPAPSPSPMGGHCHWAEANKRAKSYRLLIFWYCCNLS